MTNEELGHIEEQEQIIAKTRGLNDHLQRLYDASRSRCAALEKERNELRTKSNAKLKAVTAKLDRRTMEWWNERDQLRDQLARLKHGLKILIETKCHRDIDGYCIACGKGDQYEPYHTKSCPIGIAEAELKEAK